jgi:hypothetical protein
MAVAEECKASREVLAGCGSAAWTHVARVEERPVLIAALREKSGASLAPSARTPCLYAGDKLAPSIR